MKVRRYGRTLMVVAGVLCWASAAAAMYTPNPAGRWAAERFFVAGDFQYITSKDLDPPGKIEDVAGFFVRPGYSLLENFVVYGRLGFQTADRVDTGFAGGFGLQGAFPLPRASAWAVGGAIDYLHWSADTSRGRNIRWNEFQLSGAVSYQPASLPGLTPYAGLLFNFVDGRGSLSEDDPVGLLFGASFDASAPFRLEGQFRVVSETGFLLSFAYVF